MSPTLVQSLNGRNISQIACATWHTAAISSGGHVYTWGNGSNGKLGHSDEENQDFPKLVDGINGKVTQIACGDFHTAVLTGTPLI